VSLLADFVSHRGANQTKSFDEFMAWLSEQRHQEIRELLVTNTTATIGIKALLGESYTEILDRLRSLDRSMAVVASNFDSYRAIAEASHPRVSLSPQAIFLLEQFNDSGASKVREIHTLEGVSLCIVSGGNGSLEFTDERFLQDDLQALVDAGFLDVERIQRDRLYSFKRAGARFVSIRRGV